MPPAVTYWTGVWDPAREALSKEVEALRAALSPGSPVVSFSLGQRTSLVPRTGVVRLSGKRWLILRALAAAIEPRGQLTHVVGELGPWHLLRALGRRPILCTVAIEGPPVDRRLYDKVSHFVAETDGLAASLVDAGVAPDRVSVIYPGVDLRRFQPLPLPPPRPFRILFASTPSDAAEFDARGIPLLVEAARRCPDIHVTLLWRQWGRLDAARAALGALRLPPNVEVVHRDAADMAAVYNSVHATACLYAEGFGKSCPQSVIESLACGRPVLVSESLGVACRIAESSAGVVTRRTCDEVVNAIERLRADLPLHAGRAAPLARTHFSLESFESRYRTLYARAASTARTHHDRELPV